MEHRPPTYVLGPILANALLQCFCEGIILGQLSRYQQEYSDDSKATKSYVYILGLATIVQTIFIIYHSFVLLIASDDNLASRIMVTTFIDLLINGIICSLCQLYLIHRCWKVTGNSMWVIWPLSVLSITIFAAAMLLCIGSGFGTRINSNFISSVTGALLFWVFGSVALEVVVTTILITFLYKSKTGQANSDRVLENITRITWSTPLLPCVFMIVAAILNRIRDRNPMIYQSLQGVNAFFVLITGKFYALGILRTINSRTKWRERMKSHDIGRVSLSDWQWEQHTVTPSTDSTGLELTRRISAINRRTSDDQITSCNDLVQSGGRGSATGTSRMEESRRSVMFTSPVIDSSERGFSNSRSDPGRPEY